MSTAALLIIVCIIIYAQIGRWLALILLFGSALAMVAAGMTSWDELKPAMIGIGVLSAMIFVITLMLPRDRDR